MTRITCQECLGRGCFRYESGAVYKMTRCPACGGTGQVYTAATLRRFWLALGFVLGFAVVFLVVRAWVIAGGA